MNIRTAHAEDSQTLEDFLAFNNGEEHRSLAQSDIQSMCAKDYHHPAFFVCENKGKIIGAAAISEATFTIGTWGISWVSVHPDYRNQGLGEKLLDACCAEITRRAGKPVTVILATYADNQRLYEKSGFTKAGQDHAGGWYMLKILKS